MKKRSINGICILICATIIYSMIFSLIFLSVINNVRADDFDTYNVSIPNITVTYHEIPVNVLSKNLFDTNTGKKYSVFNLTPLDGILYDYYMFNFTTVFLPNAQYQFSVRGMAADGTINDAEKTFNIQHPEMAVWLISPPVGIGSTPNYDIVVGTEFPAICKWSPIDFDASCNSDLSCMYGKITDFFDITGNTVQHTLHYTSSSTLTYMNVICFNPADPNPLTAFGITGFWVGYQNTKPVIIKLNATNNPIMSKSDKTTTVNAVTDQNTVCRLTGGNTNPNYYEWNDSYFTDADSVVEDPKVFTTYGTQHSFYLEYWDIDNKFSRIDFNYSVACYNYAQLNDTDNITILYNLSNTVTITSLMPQYLSDNVDYEVLTSIVPSTCSLFLDKQFVNTMSPVESDITKATHWILYGLQLHPGTNIINVTCTYIKDYSAEFTHIVDTSAPLINITTTSSSSCGLQDLRFGFQAADPESGIAYYNYTISLDGTTVLNWTKTAATNIIYSPSNLEPGTYTINANAFNNAGLEGDASAVDITVLDPLDVSCDNTKPSVKISLLNSTQYQETVNVTCTDNRKCSDTFGYYFSDDQQYSCANAPYDTKSYASDLPLQFTGVGKLCIIVYDENNNNATAESVITLSKAECGNNIIDNVPELNYFERCDGSTLGGATCQTFGFKGGILGCSADCQDYDTTNCDAGSGFCGNNKIDNNNLEQCDGADWGKIKTCQDFNFTGGTLTCNAPYTPNQCMFNTTQCTPSIVLPKQCDAPANQIVLDSGEQCENSKGLPLGCSSFDNFFGGDIFCVQCNYDISQCTAPAVCGNGKIESGEDCEGTQTQDCNQLNPDMYDSGTATCKQCHWDTSQCHVTGSCGDGMLEDNELCDGNQLRGITCTDLGYQNGILRCSADCQSYDASNCGAKDQGYCGDNVLQEPNTAGIFEQCDGNTPSNASWGRIRTCQDFGFTGGTLGCYASGTAKQCMFDTSQCTPKASPPPSLNCGDQLLAAGEQCENTQAALPLTCSSFDGFDHGAISCDSCFYNLAACLQPIVPVCGDGIRQGKGESCDGTDWGNITGCTDFQGMSGGTLQCTNCQFNLSECTAQPVCGNNILDNGEQCDNANLGGKTCADFGFTGGTLGCFAGGTANQCQWDTSSCTNGGHVGVCGDGTLDPGEKCDGTVNNPDFWMQSLGCTGTIYCSSNCTIECATTKICGDNVIQKPNDAGQNEQCDGKQLGQGMNCSYFDTFVGGILSCNPPGSSNECTWNTSNCDAGYGFCGNGRIDTSLGEQCDGSDWGKIKTCQDFGFTGGTLSCADPGMADQCKFDTSKCITPPGTGVCGDGVLNTNEQCESTIPFSLTCLKFDNFTGGTLSCNAPGTPGQCLYDTSQCTKPVTAVCGDGVVEPGETCEGEGSTKPCSEFPGFTGGDAVCHSCQYDTSQCKPLPSCGNNVAEGTEQCDGTDIGLMSCKKIDSFIGGLLGCYAKGSPNECMFDTSNCNLGTGYCGDNIINNFPNEACDGNGANADWGNISKAPDVGCQQLGFDGGTLSCSSCGFDTSQCTTTAGPGPCGNGILNPGEECEPTISLDISCTNIDRFIGGTLGCTSDCKLDVSNCEPPKDQGYCGDNTVNNFPNEQCDGTDWGSIRTCHDLSSVFTGGTLTCNAPFTPNQCTFDTSQCTSPSGTGSCGDGVLNTGEECEAGIPLTASCSQFDNFTGGTLGCNYNTCQFDLSNCQAPGISCGDGIIERPEQCDGTNLGPTTDCSQLDSRFSSGSLSCYAPGTANQCKYDLSNCVEQQPVCGNGLIEDRELCDGTSTGLLSCQTFGFDTGILQCFDPGTTDQCKPDTSLCVGNNSNITGSPPPLTCGDGIIEPGEQCDGTNLGTTDWKSIMGCDVTCSACTIACAAQTPQLPAHCSNQIKDEDETDIDCGGSCNACGVGNACISNNDCQSGNCENDTCVESNQNNQNNQTSPCTVDSDCGKGKCVNGSCEAKQVSTTGLIILIIGIVLTLGSGGYIIYRTYIEKPKPKSGAQLMPRPVAPQVIDPRLLAMQQQKFAEKQQQKNIERRSLLKGFDTPAKPDEIKKIAEKPPKDYIDVTELNKGALASKGTEEEKKDVFAKLKNITEGKPLEKTVEAAVRPAEKKTEPKLRKSKIGKSRGKKPVFEKLEGVGSNYSKEELASKVSELSGKPVEKVSSTLNAEKVDFQVFNNMDRDKLLSDDFKKVLKDMLASGKIDKDSLTMTMFNYVHEGVLSKRELAKLFEDLGLLK